MKAALALHLLALGACFVVQSGGLELSGVRRALQTMETRTEPSLQRIEPRSHDSLQQTTYTAV